MSQLTDRIERDLGEIASGADPSPSAFESIVARLGDNAEPEVVLLPALTPDRPTHRVWASVAAAAVVIIGSIAVLTSVGDDQSISAANLTTTFVSPRNGFSVKYLDRGEGTVTPAKQLWTFSEQADDGVDVVETGLAAIFKGTSAEFPYGSSIDEWVDANLSDGSVLPGRCGVPHSQQAEITIDGASGRIAECPNYIEATVAVGGRLYLFTLTHDRSDARAIFDAFAATIDLTPETAVDFPGLTTTFVSPTYGYSFEYHDRGGLAPATELWDPGNQPLDDRNLDGRFDAVETGLMAYFEGASTEIPGGVSIDEWVDEYVTPMAAGGCGVPRSQQAEITIDGQPGKIAECDHTEATVVAGGRLYLFIGPGPSRRNSAWFDAWIATIDLTPETAAVP